MTAAHKPVEVFDNDKVPAAYLEFLNKPVLSLDSSPRTPVLKPRIEVLKEIRDALETGDGNYFGNEVDAVDTGSATPKQGVKGKVRARLSGSINIIEEERAKVRTEPEGVFGQLDRAAEILENTIVFIRLAAQRQLQRTNITNDPVEGEFPTEADREAAQQLADTQAREDNKRYMEEYGTFVDGFRKAFNADLLIAKGKSKPAPPAPKPEDEMVPLEWRKPAADAQPQRGGGETTDPRRNKKN